MAGYVQLDRKIIKWEWYDDANTFRVFVHLLLTCNHKAAKWHGKNVLRGQVITGRLKLAAVLGLSEMQIRTSLNKLKKTGEITIKTTNKNSLITICKYNTYQSKEIEDNQQSNQQINRQITNEQPTSNQQVTTNNNDNNNNNKKERNGTVFNEFACYNAEEYILGNQKVFEEICMATNKKIHEVKQQLHLYHLWMAKNEKYPLGKGAVAAGIESWILNAKSFSKTYNRQTDVKSEKLPDANEVAKKYA